VYAFVLVAALAFLDDPCEKAVEIKHHGTMNARLTKYPHFMVNIVLMIQTCTENLENAFDKYTKEAS
jgi:hypothetical protein